MEVSDDRLRELRGHKMAMIFQDPLSALHPYYTIGSQIVEAHPGAPPRYEQEGGHDPDGRAARPRRHPQPRASASTSTRTSSPAGCASGR